MIEELKDLKLKASLVVLQSGISAVPDDMAKDVAASLIAHGIVNALTGILDAAPKDMTDEDIARTFGEMTIDILGLGTELLKKEMESRV